MQSYSDFQKEASSEKVTLAILNGSKRLISFSLHSGAVYKKAAFDVAIVTKITIDGVPLTQAESPETLQPGEFFNDRDGLVLYLRLPDDANPNNKFVTLTSKYFFSDSAVALPYDLLSGTEVYFEPMIKSTSGFGVEADIQNEALSAIEGSGSITFLNDFDFWPKNYDKITFENQVCEIFSWTPKIDVSEAKRLFRGYVVNKSFSPQEIKLNLKDLLFQVRSTIELDNIEDLGLRNDPALDTAKQRLVYGRKEGHRPVNLDRPLNGSYPLTGRVSAFFGETSLIGTATKFKSELAVNDKVVLGNVQYTIGKVISDEAAELTSPFNTITIGNIKAEVVPSTNKSYMNRDWLIAGHALSQPEFEIQAGSGTSRLVLNSTVDLYSGDDLYIESSGELVRIDRVVNRNTVTLAQSTEIIYPQGTKVHRPCVQNVRMNDLELVYMEDYSVDPNSARLTLSSLAETNRSPLLESNERVSVVTGDNFFTGTGTKFSSYIKPGNKVRPQSTSEFYTVLSVEEEKITLTETYTGPSFTTASALPEKTSISGLASFKEQYLFKAIPGQTLQGLYFKIFDSKGSVGVWFDIGNVGTTEPFHMCNRGIEITTVDPGDAPNTILKKLAQKLNLDEEFTCTILNDTLLIENNKIGVRPAARESDAGFTVFNRSRDEQRVLCVADIADSLDEKSFSLFDGVGEVCFWIAVDNNPGAQQPDTGAYRYVKITTINTDDVAGTVRDKAKAFVEADSAFTTSNFGSDGFIATCLMVGPSVGTLPSGFELSTLRAGKSIWALNSKFFVLPHAYAVTDRTAGFWMNVDGAGIHPATGATADTEIPNLNSAFTEEQLFEAMSNVIDAHPNFNSEYSESSILVTDIASEDVSTVLNPGTSGLVLTQVQKGVTASTATGKILQYRNFVFGDSDILSCDVYGKTQDGTPNSPMLKTAPRIVKDLLNRAGLGLMVDEESFTLADDYFGEELALVVPNTFNDKATKLTYRDVINQVNNSVFGMLIQNNAFEFEYVSLRPRVSLNMPFYDHSDILSFETESNNANVTRKTTVEYNSREYDFYTKTPLVSTVDASSDVAKYIVGTTATKTFSSLCVKESDAQLLANRWSFLLERGSNSVTFETKLIASQLQINDVIQLSHKKMYERLGGTGPTKIMIVERIEKTGKGVSISAIDLSNAFNRVAKIGTVGNSYSNSNDETKLQNGFYTDDFGLIDDNENSFYTNLIW